MSDESDALDVARVLREGRQRFLDVEIRCGAGALVPRPETELLGRAAIERVRQAGPQPHVIDMCCGTGNLGCAIAVHVPTAVVFASDLTDGTVACARLNVVELGLSDRVEVLQGDLFAPLAGRGLEGRIDVVVCNPPYISSGRLSGDRATLLELEPRQAFDGGPYGLAIHQRVLRDALAFLKPGGYLLFEIGLGQDRQIRALFQRMRSYEAFELLSNEAGDPRVALGRVRRDE